MKKIQINPNSQIDVNTANLLLQQGKIKGNVLDLNGVVDTITLFHNTIVANPFRFTNDAKQLLESAGISEIEYTPAS